MVKAGRDLSSDDLARSLQSAYLTLRDQMTGEGTGTWFCAEPNSYPSTAGCRSAGIRIRTGSIGGPAPEGDGLPTAVVDVMLDGHPQVGNGLLVTVSVPVPGGFPGDPLDWLTS